MTRLPCRRASSTSSRKSRKLGANHPGIWIACGEAFCARTAPLPTTARMASAASKARKRVERCIEHSGGRACRADAQRKRPGVEPLLIDDGLRIEQQRRQVLHLLLGQHTVITEAWHVGAGYVSLGIV